MLIVRLSAIGDVAMASGLLPALRRARPDAFIAWLVEPPAADLLRHNPALDQLIVWPKQDWRRLWHQRRYRALAAELRAFRKRLRGYAFDQVLDTQGILKSGLLSWLSGAAQRIGLQSREGSKTLMTRVLEPPGGDRRLGAEYRYLAAALGLGDDYRMDIAVSETDRRAVRERLAEHAVGDYAALCPFTTRAQKHWFEPRWIDLAGRLSAEGLTPVLLGGPEPQAAAGAARIAAAAPAMINLVGQTSLGQTAALIADSRLLVGVDTGLTHLGIAFDKPTVALFGSTRPYLQPGSDRAEVLYRALHCSPCHRRPSCNGRFDCMRQHRAETVAAVAQRLLAVS